MQPGFDIGRLKQEAHTRWLKPSEILFILQNHEDCISNEVPDKPPSGSLWLFNKRVLRFFRRDGYVWKKKKDGRTGEGHERLKVDGVDAINCYYAHAEQNKYFQRRSYWMLNPHKGKGFKWNSFPSVPETWEEKSVEGSTRVSNGVSLNSSVDYGSRFLTNGRRRSSRVYEHIVLVHYREVSEGRFVYGSTNSPSCSSINGSISWNNTQDTGLTAGSSEAYLPCNQIECNGGNIEVSSSYHSGSGYGISTESPDTNLGAEIRKLKLQLSLEDYDESMLFPNQEIEGSGLKKGGTNLEQALSEAAKFLLDTDEHVELPTSTEIVQSTKENSNIHFVASMQNTFIVHSQESDWKGKTRTIDNEVDSFDFSEFWSDQNQCLQYPGVKPPLANNMLFHISEVSPEQAFSFESTKVIITGDFLSDPSEHSWAVMFGHTEVPLEIIQDGVMRCQTPKHAPGKVKLCITLGNGEPCSEVKDFEYLPMMPETNSYISTSITPAKNGARSREELLLLVRFAKQLLCVSGCASSPQNEDNSETETDLPGEVNFKNDQWDHILETILFGDENQNPKDIVDWLVQQLLQDKLHVWLSSRNQRFEITSSSLSKQEKCMIHMISGLGYEWALHPLLRSGVGVNFRDVNGWTSLHWAAKFGRERMVAALLAAGASPGAVTDPNSHDPLGQTPASIAESGGYKGLAGYLSEVALTTHLSSLGTGESESYLQSADLEAESTLEIASERNGQIHSSTTEEQLSFEDSLAAVRNATQAASRIQAAFKAHSFRKKQQNEAADYDAYHLTPEVICRLSATSGSPRWSSSHNSISYGAAMSIQKKFRGWKGRRAFLSLRQNVVKIQAHVRGHQVRKKYKEILWTVGVAEKAVLRWRRKGVGLRGFHLEFERMDDAEDDDILKAFRKIKVDESLKQSVSRVLSMANSPKAQQQYRRVLGSYRQFKAELHGPTDSPSVSSGNTEVADNDDYMKFWEELLDLE